MLVEKYKLGMDFINSHFTINNVFESVKEIVNKFISEEDYDLLNECDSYNLEIIDNEISEINFIFGKPYKEYKVTLNRLYFRILQQEEYSNFSKKIIHIHTYKLKFYSNFI